MRTSIIVVLALAAAAPAAAADRTFPKTRASLLTEAHVGQPLWTLMASCAGAHGAAHAYFAQRGRSGDADWTKAAGTQYLEFAVDRLVVDRRIDRDAAVAMTLPLVEQGRANGVSALDYPRQHEGTKWRALRTACEEIAEAR